MNDFQYDNVSIIAGIFWLVVGALIGYVIGNSKNRPFLGFILGLLLGCIGWIIMLIIPRKVVAIGAGWHADPFGRHEKRYYNGVTWQAQVSDNGIQSIDDVSGLAPPPPPIG